METGPIIGRRKTWLYCCTVTHSCAAAFGIASGRDSDVFGRRIFLVDEVLTTGATVAAATRTLKKAVAADVTVLTFARAFGVLI